MKTTSKIIDGTLHEYNKQGKLIHFKDNDGFEEWYDYDEKGNHIHTKDSDGFEEWYEYNKKGKLIHRKYSDGFEAWYNSKGINITKEEFDKNNN